MIVMFRCAQTFGHLVSTNILHIFLLKIKHHDIKVILISGYSKSEKGENWILRLIQNERQPTSTFIT